MLIPKSWGDNLENAYEELGDNPAEEQRYCCDPFMTVKLQNICDGIDEVIGNKQRDETEMMNKESCSGPVMTVKLQNICDGIDEIIGNLHLDHGPHHRCSIIFHFHRWTLPFQGLFGQGLFLEKDCVMSSNTDEYFCSRQIQSKFVKDRNWDQYHLPRNLLLALVGEFGELAELFQWRGEVQEGLPDWTEEDKEHLSQELSDVLLYLVRLSEKCRIDLPAAVLKKIALNADKYAIAKVWGSNKKYSE
ncbi:dCTP pyrophosphatase 1 [Caerostris extrusa]|uniref:dCTP pyrophosphatase 1 n=1 Tax=Caerostris extrusa TaxID=172846 RepID=A0AAV4UZV9_CAEEX|nr:dCTP pyrophosphatase 1 [Caerostris extrusa]